MDSQETVAISPEDVYKRQVLDTRKKSMAGMMERAKKGLCCGGRVPLGYNIEDGQYIINESEARIVRMIFKAYAAGESYPEILRRLAGKTTKRGRAFTKNSFHSILQNERYIGTYKWNEYKIHIMRKWAGGKKTDNPVILDGVIPPIIDKDTWERVQKRVKDNKRNAANKAKREYLLSGLIECASCGAAYIGHCSTNKRKDGSIREHRYYGCGNKYRSGACQSASVNADELELFVVSHIKAAILDWEDVYKRQLLRIAPNPGLGAWPRYLPCQEAGQFCPPTRYMGLYMD